jgi:hypothetical protein
VRIFVEVFPIAIYVVGFITFAWVGIHYIRKAKDDRKVFNYRVAVTGMGLSVWTLVNLPMWYHHK